MIRFFSYLMLLTVVSFSTTASITPPLIHDYSSGLFRFQQTLAKKGNSDAQYKLARMYQMGLGIAKNEKEALIWLNKAAAQGHNKAKHKLLFIEIKEQGLNEARIKQLDSLQQQAKGKNPDAQYCLGRMYAEGVGVTKDLDKAIIWFNKAAFNGDNEAEDDAIAIEEELNRLEFKKIKSRKVVLDKRKKEKKREKAQKKKQRQQALNKKRAKVKALEKQQRQDALNLAKLEEQNLAEREAEVRRLLNVALAEEEAKKIAEEEYKRELQQINLANENQKKKTRLSTFQSAPCKGKSAKFLSICR
ncbi:hypothetical protein MNBD_GAMMA07-2216 [hydrothermal vent metagenome]|uniref:TETRATRICOPEPTIDE REPEAT FAMILY PROTEIN n=1 Tax=hydrothermal vent metagenome TaxID=652676 RepID=A0A3B0WZ25_9ZZZZ